MSAALTIDDISFRHVSLLTDDRGILEHAKGVTPRYQHGYCTDDNARLLLVASRANDAATPIRVLANIGLQFVLEAMQPDGTVRNRLTFERCWIDDPCLNDCWGRALWALGTAFSRSTDHGIRSQALAAFERSCVHRSEYLRSMAFAALGAAEVLDVEPDHIGAATLLAAAAERIVSSTMTTSTPVWSWPEPRLTYANAVLPETLLAAGSALDEPSMTHWGLELLEWLVDTETHNGHLSVTPTTGRGPGDAKPAFDQQPIEVAAIADAAARAFRITNDSRWRDTLRMAIDWFNGANDANLPMFDRESGGGYDGMHEHAVNVNQGAESTLAVIATLQYLPLVATA
jgi:hypothetical protein